MPRWFVLLAFPVVLGFACVAATMAARELDPATAYQRAEAARHDAAMNAIAEAEAQERARVLAPALALAGAVGAVGVTCLLLTLGAVYAYHRYQFVNVQGVSVSRQLALAGATYPAMMTVVTANGQAAIEAARNPAPLLPSGLRSYSPRYANRELAAPRQASPVTASPALPPPPAPPVPTLAQVFAARPANEVIVGYERDGHPVSLDLDAIRATLVIGGPRTGKSTTVAAVAAQLAAMRAQFFVVDPHALTASADSLARRLAPLGNRVALCVSAPAEAEGVLNAVTSELERRLAGEEGDPCILLVDELNSMTVGAWADVGAQVAALAQRIAREGGKMGMGVIAAAHLADVASVGSHLAYTTSTTIVHRAVPEGVRRFIGPDLARQARHLGKGEVLVSHPTGWGLLRVPRAEPGDIMQAVALLPRLERGTVLEPGTTEPPSSALSAENRSQEPRFPIELRPLTEAEAEAVRHMRANGMSKTAINHTVFGGYKNDRTWAMIDDALGEG